MGNNVRRRDLGALLKVLGQAVLPAVAGGATTPVNGESIDRLPAGSSQRYDSCSVIGALVGASLVGAQTGTLTITMEESPDNSAWSAVSDFAPDPIVVTGGGVESAPVQVDANLEGRQRYVRFVSSLAVSAGAGSVTYGSAVALSPANMVAA